MSWQNSVATAPDTPLLPMLHITPSIFDGEYLSVANKVGDPSAPIVTVPEGSSGIIPFTLRNVAMDTVDQIINHVGKVAVFCWQDCGHNRFALTNGRGHPLGVGYNDQFVTFDLDPQVEGGETVLRGNIELHTILKADRELGLMDGCDIRTNTLRLQLAAYDRLGRILLASSLSNGFIVRGKRNKYSAELIPALYAPIVYPTELLAEQFQRSIEHIVTQLSRPAFRPVVSAIDNGEVLSRRADTALLDLVDTQLMRAIEGINVRPHTKEEKRRAIEDVRHAIRRIHELLGHAAACFDDDEEDEEDEEREDEDSDGRSPAREITMTDETQIRPQDALRMFRHYSMNSVARAASLKARARSDASEDSNSISTVTTDEERNVASGRIRARRPSAASAVASKVIETSPTISGHKRKHEDVTRSEDDGRAARSDGASVLNYASDQFEFQD